MNCITGLYKIDISSLQQTKTSCEHTALFICSSSNEFHGENHQKIVPAVLSTFPTKRYRRFQGTDHLTVQQQVTKLMFGGQLLSHFAAQHASLDLGKNHFT